MIYLKETNRKPSKTKILKQNKLYANNQVPEEECKKSHKRYRLQRKTAKVEWLNVGGSEKKDVYCKLITHPLWLKLHSLCLCLKW